MNKSWIHQNGEDLYAHLFYGTRLPRVHRYVISSQWEENIPLMEEDLVEGEQWEVIPEADQYVITSKCRIYNLQKKKWSKSIKSYSSLTKHLRVNKQSKYFNISEFIEDNFGIVYDANNLPEDVKKNILYANEKNKYKGKKNDC
jgi:hypothetical protein